MCFNPRLEMAIHQLVCYTIMLTYIGQIIDDVHHEVNNLMTYIMDQIDVEPWQII